MVRVLEGLKQQRRKPPADRDRQRAGVRQPSGGPVGLRERTAVALRFNAGRPMENGYIESFNGKFRDECLNENWFFDLADARRKDRRVEGGLQPLRPHSALGYQNTDGVCRFVAGRLRYY